MSFEGSPSTEDASRSRNEQFSSVVDDVTTLLTALRQNVRDYPIVTIAGKNVEFDPDAEPNLIKVAKIQSLGGAFANLAEKAANNNEATAEQAYRLAEHALNALEAFYGSMDDARRIHPELAALITRIEEEVRSASLDDDHASLREAA